MNSPGSANRKAGKREPEYKAHEQRIEELRRLSWQLHNAARMLEMGDRPGARDLTEAADEALRTVMRWWTSP